MTCGELRARLDRLQDGALAGAERDSALRHLACCTDCGALAAASGAGRPVPPRALRVATPLLLVACIASGALLLARCGQGGSPAGETEVAKGPGDEAGEPGAAGPATTGAPLEGHPAQPPDGETVTAPIGQVQEPKPPVTPKPINMARTPVAPADVGEPPKAPVPPGSPTETPQPAVKWPEAPTQGPTGPAGPPLPQGPSAPPPPTPTGPLGGPVPPAPAEGAPPPDTQRPTGPTAPTGEGQREGPGEITSPKEPTPAAPPGNEPPGAVALDTAKVQQLARVLEDGDRGLSERVRAAEELGAAHTAEAAEALLAAVQTEPHPRLRQAAAQALGAMGGAHGQSALRRALESLAPDALELAPLLAGELRRVGASAYLATRLTADLFDFSARIRARGALGAGAGELLSLGPRLVELLGDGAPAATGAPTLAGRAVPGLSGPSARVEVRHAAWRGLTLLAQGADYGTDAGAWTRWLARRAQELGAPPAAVAPPATPPAFGEAEGAALLGRLPALPRALASRDPQVLDDVLYQLRTTLDFGALPATDAVGALLRGLSRYASAGARDADCAAIYVEALQRRDPPPLSAVLGLANAGPAGRRAWVARAGVGGVARLVRALEASRSDPEAPYREGGALLRVLDGFQPGADPARPFCERGDKGLEARAADQQAFAAAAAEMAAWWRSLGDGVAWDAATATVSGAKK
jgi:hypothetical protein